jgi:hypothetical protein
MDFARLIEEIEREKAKIRQWAGKKFDNDDLPLHGAEGRKGETREIVAEKIGMGKASYGRAKYIAENAPEEIIEELDKGQRSIRGTYDELRAKDAAKQSSDSVSTTDKSTKNEPATKTESPQKPYNTAGLLSKADEEAIQRNKAFNAMSPQEKITELQRQLKEECIRANKAESELTDLKALRRNELYHKDGIIENLRNRLADAEARLEKLENSHVADTETK